jgi:hypothetical protein
MRYFVFDSEKIDVNWFASLFTRLKELCKHDIDALTYDWGLSDAWRYHAIDWTSKKIPISRSDLDLPGNIANNEEEYPMMQLAISTGRGRIVGYWDSEIFNIVLLDPLHNIQPSKDYDYNVDDSKPTTSQYSSLLKDVNDLKSKRCIDEHCPIHSGLQKLPTKSNHTNLVYAFVDHEVKGHIDEHGITKLLEMGVVTLLDKKEDPK